jgi:uncharacterized Fe-S cluster-containing radical SAM superfamily protein
MLNPAFATMPITYYGLVVERTTRCNAKCGMCYQAAGPKGSDLLGKAALGRDLVERVLREARTIPTLGSKFHLSGGEGFLQADECIYLFAAACNAGYQEISTTTNAFWAAKPAAASAMVQRLQQAGMTRMEISWDAWHLPYISAQSVSNAIEACVDYGIETCLRLLATKSNSIGDALRLLRPEALACVAHGTAGPVFPTGRAQKEIPIEDIYFPGNGAVTCHAVLNLTVNAKGNVSPCCAGYDQTETLLLGNVHDESIVDIAERMNRSLFLRTLLFGGPAALLPILDEAGCGIPGPHSNICHLCWNIFSDPTRARAIERHFNAIEYKGLEHAVALLKEQLAGRPENSHAGAHAD